MIITSPNSWKLWAQTFPQRAAADAPYKSPFRVVGKSPEAAEILIYDQIGRDFWSGEGMAANDFAELLKDIDPKAELTIGINSPGGNVWDGLAIHNMLVARKARVITRNDGMAASIASIVLQAGQERVTNSAAMVMIHKAWGLMIGNSDDAAQFKVELDKHDKVIAEILSMRSGKSFDEVLAAMSAETFYTGQEAKDFGLVDTVIGGNAAKNFAAKAAEPGNTNVAAGNHQPQNKVTMPENTTAPAAQTPPANVIDLGPVIEAINGLKDSLKPATPLPGTEPVAATRVENLGNPLVEKFNELKYDHAARAQFTRRHYADLRNALIAANPGANAVFNSNTVDSSLANTLLSGEFITTMRTQTAVLGAFGHKVEIAPLAPRDTIKVELVSSAGSTQTNPSNFETGDTTSDPITVSVNHISRSFHVPLSERNVGLALAAKAPTNAKIISEKLVATITALITNGNFGADNVIGSAANFDATDLPGIMRLDSNIVMPRLILHRDYVWGLMPTNVQSFKFGEPGAYGIEGGIYGNNLWTGAATDIVGVLTGPDAIVWGSAPSADQPSGEFISVSDIVLDCGASVQAFTWYSRASRAIWGSFDICFGAAKADTTQLKVLTSQ